MPKTQNKKSPFFWFWVTLPLTLCILPLIYALSYDSLFFPSMAGYMVIVLLAVALIIVSSLIALKFGYRFKKLKTSRYLQYTALVLFCWFIAYETVAIISSHALPTKKVTISNAAINHYENFHYRNFTDYTLIVKNSTTGTTRHLRSYNNYFMKVMPGDLLSIEYKKSMLGETVSKVYDFIHFYNINAKHFPNIHSAF